MRRSNSVMIPAFAAGRSRSATGPGAAWSPPPATRPASSASARPCPRPRPWPNAPGLVFVPPRFEVYKAVSRQIHAIFADYTDLIEPLSLDEAYLDVTANRRGLETASRDRQGNSRAHPGDHRSDGLGRDLLQQVPGQARLGPAKAQRPVRRPARQGRGLRPDPADRPLPRRGRGHRSQDEAPGHPHRRGPASPEPDLPAAPFRPVGSLVLRIARGEDDRPVNPDRVRKSSGSETTFDQDHSRPRRSRPACWPWPTMSGPGAKRPARGPAP
jgi:DNA polymerase-4